MFTHLNIHSVYSPMRGLLSLSDLVFLSNSEGMDTLALTDINGLWGFIRFVQHCKDADISPIAGTNLITKKDEAIILAENQYGYENICRVLSAIHDNPNQSVVDVLRKNFTGLFVLSYNINTLKALMNFIPNSHLFIELRPGIQESFAHKLAKNKHIANRAFE